MVSTLENAHALPSEPTLFQQSHGLEAAMDTAHVEQLAILFERIYTLTGSPTLDWVTSTTLLSREAQAVN
jgi:hypothetical protein